MNNPAIIGNVDVSPPCGIRWRNWRDDPEVKPLRSKPRRRWHGPAPRQIVVHESVTKSWEAAYNVLTRRHLGVHLMIARDGSITQHADLMALCAHAGAGRNNSVGVEIINGYYEKYAHPGQTVIDARWAHKGRYTVPTDAQIETLAKLLPWLCEVTGVPFEFIGLRGGKRHTDKETGMSLGRMSTTDGKRPGIAAHTYWAHADGGYPVLAAFRVISGRT